VANRNINLNANILILVHELFIERNWSLKPIEHRTSLYERFCERLSIFNYDEQVLLIELAKNFELVPLNNYFECFWSAYFDIPEDILERSEQIFFMPLIDFSKRSINRKITKSSEALYYYMSNNDSDWVHYSEKFKFPENLNDLMINFSSGSILILIDDYIGSGKTACKALSYYKGLGIGLSSENLFVLTLAAQKNGVKEIKNRVNCRVFSDKIFNRGISDTSDELSKRKLKLNTMKKMEEKISSLIEKKGFSLGYEKSEALVSLADKTPNNTFPVFWYETETKKSPFPRFRNIAMK
jgi:hypothetical protein